MAAVSARHPVAHSNSHQAIKYFQDMRKNARRFALAIPVNSVVFYKSMR
jgi:hypothetical protein